MSGIAKLDALQNWETDWKRSQLLWEMGRVRMNGSITVWSCSKMILMRASGTMAPRKMNASSSGGKPVPPSSRIMTKNISSRNQK